MKYRVELSTGQRLIEADMWLYDDDWVTFYQKPPQGGKRECWRVALTHVISIETCHA